MTKFIAVLLGCVIASSSSAQTIDAPALKAGDTWVYRNTIEKGPTGWNQTRDEVTVTRSTPSSIYFSTKANGSTGAPKDLIAGADWSRMRDVNGTETVVSRPLAFPLSAGKAWELQYTEQHPNKGHRYEQWNNTYKVVGFETIEVPAGKFNALKIESEGKWVAQLEPTNTVAQGAQSTQSNTTMVTQVQKTTGDTISGRTYKAIWYVPEVKRWVKSVEEYYNNGGVRNERYVGELESYKVAD
jgi:uncharacterized protein (UPF0333 family)